MSAELLELREAAGEIARGAGAIVRAQADARHTITYKDAGVSNLVTEVDRRSEDFILGELARRFPGHAVLAEESGAAGAGANLWYIDPLDGTVNFAHGVPHFCVSLALEVADGAGRSLAVAAVYDPLRDELFQAARGQGATLNGRPIHVSSAPDLRHALMCTGFPYDLSSMPKDPLGLFTLVVPRAQGIRRMGAAALDLCYVACGRFDGFFEFGLSPWDTAGGALCVLEAGGRVVGLDGAPYAPQVKHLVSATPKVAEELVPLCTRYLASQG